MRTSSPSARERPPVTAKRIIPCLDVDAGRVVKGVRFQELRDAGDPAELAAFYDRQGADEVVFLDITATSEGRRILLDAVARTADKVSLNSAALADPPLITRCADVFGSQCVVLAIDARRRDEAEDWEVFSHGGRRATGRDAVEWAVEGVKLGAGEILLTSMDRDGTLDGYDLGLLEAVTSAVRVPVIASGGAGGAGHMYDALTTGGAEAALAASIFHFGEVSIAGVKTELARRGLEVRL